MLLKAIFAPPAYAGTRAFPDLTRENCSITVTLRDVADTTRLVGGGRLALYRVADAAVDNGFRFLYAGAFAELDGKTGWEIGTDTDLDQDLENRLYEQFVLSGKAVPLSTVTIGTDGDDLGRATFTGLQVGLYLVVQPESATHYATIRPFLVTIPRYGEDGTAIYAVDAYPKAGTVERLAPCTADPPVVKVVRGANAPKRTFHFAFTRLNSTNPMPVNVDGSLVSLTGDTEIIRVTADKVGADGELYGAADAGILSFDAPGIYRYTYREENSGDPEFRYDETVYYITYTVEMLADGKSLGVTLIEVRDGTAEGEVVQSVAPEDPVNAAMDSVIFGFTNEYIGGSKGNPGPSGGGGGSGGTGKPGVRVSSAGTGDGAGQGSQLQLGDDASSAEVLPAARDGETATEDPSSIKGRNRLPQTGQVRWPVPLMMVLGLGLLQAGIYLRKDKPGLDDSACQ